MVVDGYMDLPDKTGFGVEMIDYVAKKFPFIPGRNSMLNPPLKEGIVSQITWGFFICCLTLPLKVDTFIMLGFEASDTKRRQGH